MSPYAYTCADIPTDVVLDQISDQYLVITITSGIAEWLRDRCQIIEGHESVCKEILRVLSAASMHSSVFSYILVLFVVWFSEYPCLEEL
ncbi:hypothetical protein GOODEAATRI_005106 [Goodea atripinnis]|uniref:Uncharacterized protein n=1 Tax=Goodea atripinnis TaxID=208336 RepID=A0ABV0MPG7_9TELE